MPSITFWTRLEPFTRLDDIEAGLQARVHDPLWALARQWQTGEFQGEDGGTPIQARVRMERATLSRFHAGPADGAVAGRRLTSTIPLEALAEREAVQVADDARRDRRLAAEAGLMFMRMLERAGVAPAVRGAFVAEPGFALRASADDPAAGEDPAGDAYLAMLAGRMPDGFRLYAALRRSLPERLPARPEIAAAEQPKVIEAAKAYVAWFEARYCVPPAGVAPAWMPERMEYSFAVAAAIHDGAIALSAPEYPGGTLDWHSFDVDFGLDLGVRPSDPQSETVTRTVIPSPVRYPGMAADRWWEFEDARVDFSRIEGDPDELLRLLLVDFALLYSNDWFILPVDLPVGALYHFGSLVVTDAFGVRTLVPHYTSTEPERHDWRMFAVAPSHDVLFLPPVLTGSLHGDPIEDVSFMRDEPANLVWAVERLVPSLAGGALDRAERERQRPLEVAPNNEATEDDALAYRLATTVPPHFIPFKPVRPDPAQPDIRLRRAAALVERDGAAGLTRPYGRILEPPDLSLFEEEVPANGVRLVRRYQHARWVDGSTVVWLARRKQPGRGELSSGLQFDLLEGDRDG